jgi:glyoxalase family protein
LKLESAGIHHLTAIASDPQENLDFYAGVLGLRLVKRTVNFDDPGTYHLYYGDESGRPGSLITFFPWPGLQRGRIGPPQVTTIAFAVPKASLGFWRERLALADIHHADAGDDAIALIDPDGLSLQLVADPNGGAGWGGGPVPAAHAVRGIHSATIDVGRAAGTAGVLRQALGFSEDRGGTRFLGREGAPGRIVEMRERRGAHTGQMGAGVVHHIAFRARDDAEQAEWAKALREARIAATPVQDRQYFHSIYFHEPAGVLFEIATDPPGFALDEPLESLGMALKLPPWLEPIRARIEQALPPLRAPRMVQPK